MVACPRDVQENRKPERLGAKATGWLAGGNSLAVAKPLWTSRFREEGSDNLP